MSAPVAAPPKYDWLAAGLGYLVPGLGQIYQGRIGKGILYFVCLYGLFFYGMALGSWRNVWLADAQNLQDVRLAGRILPGTLKDLNYRKEFIGQFWIGIAAWPAIIQYNGTKPLPSPVDPVAKAAWKPTPNALLGTYMQTPNESYLNEIQRNGDKTWDFAWICTVIAGSLNVLAIYDALAGPLIRDDETDPKAGGAGA